MAERVLRTRRGFNSRPRDCSPNLAVAQEISLTHNFVAPYKQIDRLTIWSTCLLSRRLWVRVPSAPFGSAKKRRSSTGRATKVSDHNFAGQPYTLVTRRNITLD